MSEIRTVLFIPGAWHSTNCFDPVIQRLEAANYKTIMVHLPSVNPPRHHRYFEADVLHIRA